MTSTVAFENLKCADTTMMREYRTIQFLRAIWGDSQVDEWHDTLIYTIVPYAANCVRFCDTAIEFETVCNGLRNVYLDATAAK